MSKRITVTLTEKQWGDVLYVMENGFEQLHEMILNNRDQESVQAWRKAVKDGEKVEARIISALNGGTK